MLSFKVAVFLTQFFSHFNTQETRHHFVAADKGNYPKCQIYGRTYCLQIDDYPREKIKYLLENHLFDFTSLMLSEGLPVSDFGDDEKPKFHLVNKSEEVTFFTNQPVLNSDNDPRSKRRDNFRHPTFSSSQNNVNDEVEKQSRSNPEQSLSMNNVGFEYLRAGQSDTDLISMKGLEKRPERIDPTPLEVQKYVDPESELKKSLFEELKSLDDGSFTQQDSLFTELLAATAKTPKESGDSGQDEEEEEDDDEEEEEDGEDDEVETSDLVFVNQKGNFIPEVSSVQYEAPKPSKGFNFNNFLATNGDSIAIEIFPNDLENPQRVQDTPLTPQERQDFPSFFDSDEIDKNIESYQQNVATENSILLNAGRAPPIITTAVPNLERSQSNRNVLIGKLHQDQQVLELNQKRKSQMRDEVEMQGNLLDSRYSSDEVEKFLSSNHGTNVDDLRAFHDQLDRLINGDDPEEGLNMAFKNPSSISFETVDHDETGSNYALTALPTPSVTVRPHSVPTVLQAKSEMKLPERSIYFEEKPETSFNNFIPVGSKQEGVLDLGSEYESNPRLDEDDKATRVDVIIVETGKSDAITTENPVKFFDYLYRNVKEVEAPKDLRLVGNTVNPTPGPVYYKSAKPQVDVQPRIKKNDFVIASKQADSLDNVLLRPALESSVEDDSVQERSESNTAKFSIFFDESFNPPGAEYDFKPILNPPPEFFELRPVLKNHFIKDTKEAGPTDDETVQVTIPNQVAETTVSSPSAEYANEDFNNYTDTPNHENLVQEDSGSDAQPSYLQDTQDQQHLVDQRHRRKTLNPVNTGIYSAIQKVTDVLDNFFSNSLRKTRFGRSRRSRRQASDFSAKSNGEVCPTRKHFIHPVVAFSVKGQWMYLVNLAGNESHQQGIVTEECTTSKCNNVCTNDPKLEASCQPRFVQKRLIALHPNGDKLTSELFWFPATCSCKMKKV